jgi:hypothetical protein
MIEGDDSGDNKTLAELDGIQRMRKKDMHCEDAGGVRCMQYGDEIGTSSDHWNR